MVNRDEFCPVRKRGFNLNFMNHFRNASMTAEMPFLEQVCMPFLNSLLTVKKDLPSCDLKIRDPLRSFLMG
jgi:hypothetical protein